MSKRISEDFYYWCCEWCDSENRVPWEKFSEGLHCGACHRLHEAVTEEQASL
jgi:hypothetical protein